MKNPEEVGKNQEEGLIENQEEGLIEKSRSVGRKSSE